MWPTWNQISQAFDNIFNPEAERARNESAVDATRVRERCELTGSESRVQSELKLFDCAERLRAEADYNPARAILASLVRFSDVAVIRNLAHDRLCDSLGQDISDAQGNLQVEGGGETVLWPWDISRNFSDENGAGTVFDTIFLAGGLVGWLGGVVFGSWRSEQNSSLVYDRSFDHRQLSAAGNCVF